VHNWAAGKHMASPGVGAVVAGVHIDYSYPFVARDLGSSGQYLRRSSGGFVGVGHTSR